MYIIIEKFNKEWPIICTDEDGKPLIFSNIADALLEQKNCQNGQIIEI